jgi:hypothetical protein
MKFSTQQLKTTFSVVAQADELLLRTIMAAMNVTQLRRIRKTAEHSMRNKDPYFDDCKCKSCHIHAVNSEDGEAICDACLAE